MKKLFLLTFAAMLVLAIPSCKKSGPEDSYVTYGPEGKILVNGVLYNYTSGHLGDVLDGVIASDKVTSLIWKGGSIAGEDIAYMKDKLYKTLEELDLSEASFAPGTGLYPTGIAYNPQERISSSSDIPYGMFRGFLLLKKATIGNVKTINRFAFSQCPKLKELSINKVNYIEDYAFISSGIEDLILPEGLVSVSCEAFYSCPLRTLDLPSTLKSFYDDSFISFKAVSALKEVICRAKTPPAVSHTTTVYDEQKNVFGLVGDDLVIKVPAKSVKAYKEAARWSEHADSIEAI